MKSILVIAGVAVMLLAIALIARHRLEPSQEILLPVEDSPMTSIPNERTSVDAKPAPPRGPRAPEIISDTWLNSPPLSPEELRGKVVLVEFWTFDCINCRNTIPYMRALYQKYRDQGFVVVGVHTPELSFERDLANVKTAIKDQNIPYPIAIDNDFKNWNAFNVWAWPTWFILDKQGAIRFTHVGEGAYTESEQIIAQLVNE